MFDHLFVMSSRDDLVSISYRRLCYFNDPRDAFIALSSLNAVICEHIVSNKYINNKHRDR